MHSNITWCGETSFICPNQTWFNCCFNNQKYGCQYIWSKNHLKLIKCLNWTWYCVYQSKYSTITPKIYQRAFVAAIYGSSIYIYFITIWNCSLGITVSFTNKLTANIYLDIVERNVWRYQRSNQKRWIKEVKKWKTKNTTLSEPFQNTTLSEPFQNTIANL